MNIVQLAGSLARRADFQLYVSERSVPPRDVDADAAAQFIRTTCGVQSRKELEHDTAAQARFHNLIRRPFLVWQQRQQQHLRRAA